MLVKIVAAAAVAAIVLGTGVGLVVSTSVSAGGARDQAALVLKRVGADTNQIDGSLKEPGMPEITSNVSAPDFKGAKQRFDDYIAQVDRTKRVTASDSTRLRSSDDRLRAYQSNLLALPVRSSLGPGETRISAMRSAIAEADLAMAIERDQSRTLSALMDALVDLGTMSDRFAADDIIGGIAMVSGIDTKLQSASQMAKARDNPVQIDLLISKLRTSLQEIQGAFQAVERKDAHALQSLLSQLDADSQQLDALRQQLGFYEQEIYGFHVDLYHRDLQAAGFSSSTGTGV